MRTLTTLALLIALAAFGAGCDGPKPAPKAAPKKPDDASARKIIEGMRAERDAVEGKKKPGPEPDRRWVAGARQQLLVALEAKEERAKAQARRIGRMSEADRVRGSQAAGLVKSKGVESVAPQLVDLAEKYAPAFIGTMKRDAAISRGDLTGFPDQKRRKECWDKLSDLVGPLGGGRDLPPFSVLTSEQMNAAILTAESAASRGLGSLPPEERQLLLDAGALEWFGKQLKAEK